LIDLIWNFISELPVWLIGIIGFFIAMSPFPLPNETWMGFISAIQGDSILPVLFLVAGIGEFIGHSIIFLLSKKHVRKVTGLSRTEMKVEHSFHKFGMWLLLALPTLSFMVPLTDILLVIAGHERAHYRRIVFPLAGGIIIRTILGFLFLDAII
jgi:hypothetical protein